MGSISGEIDGYLASCAAQGMSAKTLIGYRAVLEGVFLEWCRGEGIEEVEGIDQGAIERYQRSLYERANRRGGKLSRHTIHAYIRPVRQLANFAHLEVTAQTPRLGKKRKPVLSREEQQRLEYACRSERDRLMVVLMGRRALRVSELVLLRGDDLVTLGREHYLHVCGKGAGGQGEERLVPLKPDLFRTLRHWIERKPDDAPAEVFYSKGRPFRPLTDSGVRQMLKAAGLEAKIGRHVHPHLLRHSVITYWRMEKGVPDAQIKMIAGNYTALDDYTHFQPGRRYAFYDALE